MDDAAELGRVWGASRTRDHHQDHGLFVIIGNHQSQWRVLSNSCDHHQMNLPNQTDQSHIMLDLEKLGCLDHQGGSSSRVFINTNLGCPRGVQLINTDAFFLIDPSQKGSLLVCGMDVVVVEGTPRLTGYLPQHFDQKK